MNSEHDLNRILTAFNDTNPPADMNHRILQHLEQTAISSQPLQFRALWAVGFATCSLVIALAMLHPHTLSSRPKAAHLAAAVERPAVPIQHIAESINESNPSAAHTPQVTRAAKITNAQSTHEPICDCDPTALAEANAPSQPSPPLPLTKEERLLERVARHPDEVEVAELNAAHRDATSAADQASFKRFFTPPPLSDEAIRILNQGVQQ
jgi:hypothetical protein